MFVCLFIQFQYIQDDVKADVSNVIQLVLHSRQFLRKRDACLLNF